MKKREKRRYLSWKASKRKQSIHLHAVHPDGVVDCVCELADWYFEKRSISCHCRKRHHGNPKYGNGICCIGLRPVVRLRIDGKRLCQKWKDLVRGSCPDDIDL